ncbi:hypothetical protein JTB14_019486 [Gonioctena quinquepunctata]|nr:hypothetical protein JTB14_019486 [Gonioctena quinquepunctata]
MPSSCAAYNCVVRYKKGLDVKFHRFPKNELMRNNWVIALGEKTTKPTATADNQLYECLEMDRLMEDAANIHQLFPWIECDRDIMNYMRKIPLDKSHLRNQLTLLHFLNLKDCENMDNFEQSIENDAREIVIMLPDIAYKLIKERLSILGNMPNRKEAVIRQLLHEKQELRSMVSELDHSSVKRKSDNIIQINNGDQGDETNIKIKIRKVEGSLEVVSSFKQEKVPVSPNSAPMVCFYVY